MFICVSLGNHTSLWSLLDGLINIYRSVCLIFLLILLCYGLCLISRLQSRVAGDCVVVFVVFVDNCMRCPEDISIQDRWQFIFVLLCLQLWSGLVRGPLVKELILWLVVWYGWKIHDRGILATSLDASCWRNHLKFIAQVRLLFLAFFTKISVYNRDRLRVSLAYRI